MSTIIPLSHDEIRLRENRKNDSKVLFFIQQVVHETIFSRIAPATTSKHACNESVQDFLSRVTEIITHEARLNRSLEKSKEKIFQVKGDILFFFLAPPSPTDEIKTFVPNVVGAISSAISELIQLGAKTLVVPRDLPFGCLPTFLKFFSGASTKDYEPETGCLKFLNRLVEYHDQLLWHELSQLRRSHPHATIIYADCYNTTISIYRSPRRYDEPIKNN
ncbi:unnamed protein product [Musa banksii]